MTACERIRAARTSRVEVVQDVLDILHAYDPETADRLRHEWRITTWSMTPERRLTVLEDIGEALFSHDQDEAAELVLSMLP